MTFWERIRSMWASHDERLAIHELKRERADAEGLPVPHAGGALFDESLHPEPIDDVPGDDLPR